MALQLLPAAATAANAPQYPAGGDVPRARPAGADEHEENEDDDVTTPFGANAANLALDKAIKAAERQLLRLQAEHDEQTRRCQTLRDHHAAVKQETQMTLVRHFATTNAARAFRIPRCCCPVALLSSPLPRPNPRSHTSTIFFH